MNLLAADQSAHAALALVLGCSIILCKQFFVSITAFHCKECNSHHFGIPKQLLQLGNHYLIREKNEFTKQAN